MPYGNGGTVAKLRYSTAKTHYQQIEPGPAFGFTLPYDQALPSSFPEGGSIPLIPADIALQLVSPEPDIAFGHDGIFAP